MKKFTAAFLFGMLISTPLFAQDTIAIPDTLRGWQTSWTVGINGSQASYSNWSQGGINNIAATGNSVFTAMYSSGRFNYGFLVNTRYGKTKIQDEGVRKIDDRLFINNRFLYDLGDGDDESDFKVFGNIRIRTQFDQGFNYGAGEDGEDILISGFMAPGYFTQDVGLAYIPGDYFTFEAGVGLQQTYIRDARLSETYGLNEGERLRSEAGLTLGTGTEISVAENLLFTSSINTFTNFKRPLRSTDIHFRNQLIARANSFLNTTLSFELVYDDDYSNRVQVAQVLSLGVSFTLR